MILALTDSDFEEKVLQAKMPVLVDLRADWCNSCKLLDPVIKDLDAEFSGQALIASLNVDEQRQVARRYGIQHIPALLFFKDGKLVDRYQGPAPQHFLSAKLRRQINS